MTDAIGVGVLTVSDMGIGSFAVVGVAREIPALLRMGLSVTARPHQPFTGCKEPELGDATLPPAVFVHGLAGVPAHVEPWKKTLFAHESYLWGYASRGEPLDALDRLTSFVKRVAEHHEQRVCLAGHSLGGLLLLAATGDLGPEYVSSCVTVCSPHQGANLPSTPLDALRVRSHNAEAGLVLAITAEHDLVVDPQDALVGDTEWALVRGAGHLSVVSHPRTAELLVRACAHDSAEHGFAYDAALPHD